MKKMMSVAAVALLGSMSVDAAPGQARPVPEKLTTCSWESVARKWNVNPHVLYAIAKTESNLNPNAINKSNANGSEDVGMMQINSFWFKHLAERYGITRDDLFNPCISLEVGAYVLSQNMERHGNTWKAIGAYNAVTPWKQVRYANLIYGNLPTELRGERPREGN